MRAGCLGSVWAKPLHLCKRGRWSGQNEGYASAKLTLSRSLPLLRLDAPSAAGPFDNLATELPQVVMHVGMAGIEPATNKLKA